MQVKWRKDKCESDRRIPDTWRDRHRKAVLRAYSQATQGTMAEVRVERRQKRQ